MTDSHRFAFSGDAIVMTRLSRREDDGFRRTADHLRGADFAMTNLETTVHDHEGYPAAGRDIHLRAPPAVIDELVDAGVDAVTAANNHMGDFSREGMLATMRELESRELPYAGLGRSLSDARAPAYVETSAGRVGVVAATTTYDPGDLAGPVGPELSGRPGVAPLGVGVQYTATEETMASLRTVSENLGFEDVKRANEEAGVPAADDDGTFRLLNVDGPSIRFQRGPEDGFERVLDADHRDALFRRIGESARQADWTVCSLHAHESVDGSFADRDVPAFVESFARNCVEAGADAVVSHGPHVVRGAEIYDGSPIFYGLGDFVVQELLLDRLSPEVYDQHGLDRDATPADVFDAIEGQYLLTRAFWETVLPVCEYEDGTLAGIELHPLELGYDRPRPQRGVPRPAEGETARRILREFDECCDAYDVEVRIEDGRGRIEV